MKIVVEVSNPRESSYVTSNDAWDVDVVLTGDVEERGEATVYWDQYSTIGTIAHSLSDHLVTLMGWLNHYDRANLRQTIEALSWPVIEDGETLNVEIEVQYEA